MNRVVRFFRFHLCGDRECGRVGILVRWIDTGTPIACYRNSGYAVFVAEIFEGVDGCTGGRELDSAVCARLVVIESALDPTMIQILVVPGTRDLANAHRLGDRVARLQLSYLSRDDRRCRIQRNLDTFVLSLLLCLA